MPDEDVLGVDPHRRGFTATILDGRGAVAATEHFNNDTSGYLDAGRTFKDHGTIDRWGVENGAASAGT